MRSALTKAVLLASLALGCGKEASDQAVQDGGALVPPEESAKVEAQLIPAPNAKADASPEERLEGAVHPELTMRLQMYIERTGRMPETISEFSNTAVDSMPPAPAGMKYALDPVDKAIKVVRK